MHEQIDIANLGDVLYFSRPFAFSLYFARLHFAYKYSRSHVSEALLASANAGGENVHRNEAVKYYRKVLARQLVDHGKIMRNHSQSWNGFLRVLGRCWA